MDLSNIVKKLGLSESKQLIRKATELRRLCDIQFDSSIIGVGEICKAIVCLEIAATRNNSVQFVQFPFLDDMLLLIRNDYRFQVIFDRQKAIRLSGMSEKAYNRSFNSLQNGLGVKNKLDIREMGIQFGCVRLIPFVHKGLSLYKNRFLASLPAFRRASADFTQPVFIAVAFYLCAKRHKLKEYQRKKDPRDVKGNRELLDALPDKRTLDDGGYLSDDGKELLCYKKRKRMDKLAYEEWKSTVLASSNHNEEKDFPSKRTKQARLNFVKEVPETQEVEAV